MMRIGFALMLLLLPLAPAGAQNAVSAHDDGSAVHPATSGSPVAATVAAYRPAPILSALDRETATQPPATMNHALGPQSVRRTTLVGAVIGGAAGAVYFSVRCEKRRDCPPTDWEAAPLGALVGGAAGGLVGYAVGRALGG